MDLKTKLQELVENSEALNSLSKEERDERVSLMMEADEEDMQEFIEALKEEARENKNIEAKYDLHQEDVEDYYLEAKSSKITEERKKRQELEKNVRHSEEENVASLLKKLEAVETNKQPVVKKSGFFLKLFKKLEPKREITAALIGLVLCGLSGILIVFGIVFSMENYVQFEFIFNRSPLIMFHAYPVALLFGALLGFFIVPALRFLKVKSFILSAIIGALIGGIMIGLAHMLLGTEYDIEILMDSKNIGVRGYWIATTFAAVMGIIAQFFKRLLTKKD